MSEPIWKSLVDQLIDEGVDSEYLTRLRKKYDVEGSRESIEREIVREMANALTRAEEKVDLALLELEMLGRRCDERGEPKLIELFNRKRDHAIRVRRDLMIHREALHFPRDPRFETRYPIPPPRRLPERT